MAGEITDVSDSNFEEAILKSSQPAIVDFWATWCVPCKGIYPIIEEFARKYSGKLKFAKMNVDDNSRTPAKYGVMGLPTILLFKNGQVIQSLTGSMGREQIDKFLQSAF